MILQTNIFHFFKIVVVSANIREVLPALVKSDQTDEKERASVDGWYKLFRDASPHSDFFFHCEVLKCLRTER